jgi:hypothetical protein
VTESLYAAATVLPIVSYLVLLLSLLLGRYLATLSVWIASQLLGAEAEREPDKIAPFSLLGICFSTVAAIAKAVSVFV